MPRSTSSSFLAGSGPYSLGERGPVESNDLRDVGGRVLGQTGHLGREEDVAGSLGPGQVAGERDAHHCGDTAAVESVTLDHDDRPAKARLGAARLPEVGPPDFALGDHQSNRSNVRSAAAAGKSLSLRVASAKTRSSVSVT